MRVFLLPAFAMKTNIGIDLGTSRCRAAAMTSQGPRMLSLSGQSKITPTAVAFTPEGLRFGSEALHLASTAPTATISSFLRLLGRKFHSPEVQWLSYGLPYTIFAAPNGDAHIFVDEREYSPEEITSFLLDHLRESAERELHARVAHAVIAIPTIFDDLQRRAILRAAELAGLSASLIHSTTAAGLELAGRGQAQRQVALLDFGAGSFNLALMNLAPSGVKTLAVAGEPMLGGDDMDWRVVLQFFEHARSTLGVDVSSDPSALLQFTRAARAGRHALSQHTRTAPISLGPFTLDDGRLVEFEHPGLSRRILVDLVTEELAALKLPCQWVFEDAGLGTEDVEDVLVIGGLGHTPALKSVVKYLFRCAPTRPENAEHLVALGAARRAAGLSGAGPMMNQQDVIPHTLGIKVHGGHIMPLVPRNLPIPCHQDKTFQASGGEQRVLFELFQGEQELASENRYLGKIALSNLASGQFEVSFQVDDNGILNVTTATAGRDEQPLEIQLAGGLSDADAASLREHRSERRNSMRAVSEHPSVHPMRRTMRPGEDGAHTIPPPPPRQTQRPPRGPESDLELASTQRIALGETQGHGPISVAADSLVDVTLGGRYLIKAVIAEGGMGRVYRAEHIHLKKQFAVKVLHPELATSREISERFVMEAQAASSINSDHVVSISDFGESEDGHSYFVMEYLDGKTLETVLDESGPLSADLNRAVAIQVADGLRGAHEKNIVHRDLKPANIVLVERPEQLWLCKILDFGIAKNPTSDSGQAMTRIGTMLGTPHYMAPEQIDGKAGTRADIYALGIVMYEMATGIPPFDADSVAEVLAKQKWSEPPRIHDTFQGADCPPSFERIILRCLEKEPAKRFASARALADALAAF